MPGRRAARRTCARGTARCPRRASAPTMSPGAWRNGSNTASCRSSGTPGPASSTMIDRPPSDGAARTQISVPAGVWRTAFEMRFSTMRSTFAASSENEPGVDVGRDDVARRVVDLVDGSGDQRDEVRRAALRRHDATLQPVEVEQVRQQALELAGVRRDAADEVEGVRRGAGPCPRLSRVSADPRIDVNGVRRSCETASRNVFFISSRLRRRCVASRSRRKASEYFCSLDRRACSARLRSVMSTMRPLQLTRALRAAHDVHDVAHPHDAARPGRRRGSRGNDPLPRDRLPAGLRAWPRGRRRRRGRPMSPLGRATRSPRARASRRPARPGT